MSGLEGKPFAIPKQLVWQAWKSVKANSGAAGADGVTIEMFEKDLKDNLYKVWNRMSSGTYFPPPVRAVEIPKSSGGTRILGVPTVGDRVSQTVAAMALGPRTEAIFHGDSYGYRPGKGALDAVGRCRERCWARDWVIDLDVSKFLDAWSHCSFADCGGLEQPVLGGWHFDTQAFPASGAGQDGVQLAALDLLQNGRREMLGAWLA